MPEQYFRNNVTAGLTLIETREGPRVALPGAPLTAATFGEPGMSHRRGPPSEPHPLRPLRREQVHRGEDACGDLAHGLKFCALRYFNVAGAWHDGSIGEDHRPESHLIPLILPGGPGQAGSPSFGTDYPTQGRHLYPGLHPRGGSHRRPLLALDYLKRTNTSAAFNLGNGQGFSNREIIEAARRVTATPSRPGGEAAAPAIPPH